MGHACVSVEALMPDEEKGAASIVVAPDTTSDESIVVGDVPLRWSGFA